MAGMLRNGRARFAAAAVTAPIRVAVYCRKSTTEGIDSGFSSIDNQRQAAENFIASQADQGWACLPQRYDDFGFSGGSMERPALRQLLADVDAGLIDVLVTIRLDRISRNLADFVRIHEFLERRGVALASVAESINSGTAHGKMLIGILATFAEYERSLARARTKEKIAGARRRGRWTGGMPPLGYDVVPEGGRLVVNKDEAEQVKAIFELYAEKGSLVATAEELNHRGWRRKSWTTKTGIARHGKPWDRVNLHRLLADPLYAGLQKLGGEVFPGEHPAIVPKALFQRVHDLLVANGANGGAGSRNQHGALLRGLLRCSACDAAMTHAWTRKGGKLYRYYICQHAQKAGWDACPTKSVKADKIERFVVDQIRRIGADPGLQAATFEQAVAQVAAQKRGARAEAKRIEKEMATTRRDVDGLTAAIAKAGGRAEQALLAGLQTAQERIATLEARFAEVHTQEKALAAQHVDEADLARALEAFTPIWQVLLAPEKERLLRLLIGSVSYDGRTEELKIQFRLDGLATLAEEVGP